MTKPSSLLLVLLLLAASALVTGTLADRYTGAQAVP